VPEFLTLLPPKQALEILLENLPQWDPDREENKQERIPSELSLGRITSRAVTAPENLPPFNRSTVDGYAVHSGDTHGATESLPTYLCLVGEIQMGAEANFSLAPGECALIHTGGMLPSGADAAIMIEHTQRSGEAEVEILRAIASGENILIAGEDVAAGEIVIPAGERLRSAEIGGLMGLGLTEVFVWKPLRVGVISTGDEIVHPGAILQAGQVRDVNSYTLRALVELAGGIPYVFGIVPDRPQALEAAARRALNETDLLIITAGSSASTRDLTAEAINQLGSPGVLVHGVNVRPGKPTILGICDHKPVIGLPGNPVSALVIAGLFMVPIIRHVLGMRRQFVQPQIQARLAINLASQSGREDWIPVRLADTGEGFLAEPVYGKSNLIFSLARADGLLYIPADVTGLAANSSVQVFLL
jgi:molybdopterin molybdotransferase